MDEKKEQQTGKQGTGITNRGIQEEKPGQDYVMDTVEGMEMDGSRDDLSTGDRLAAKGTNIGRNIDPLIDEGPLLTPEEESGGERRIDSKDGVQDHSHH